MILEEELAAIVARQRELEEKVHWAVAPAGLQRRFAGFPRSRHHGGSSLREVDCHAPAHARIGCAVVLR